MIDLESPVTTVLGGKPSVRDRVVDVLGIRTVGDLLRHFPRRYLRTGELTRIEDLQEGELLTVVGEIASSTVRSYVDRRTRRPAYRLEAVLRTDGPDLRMTFFAKSKHIADWQARHYRVGVRGLFLGKADRFRGEWQLNHPQVALFGRSESDTALLTLGDIGDWYPLYPTTAKVESWDLQKAVAFARSVIDDVPDLLPADVRERYALPDARTALDLIHAPRDLADVEAARRRYRFEEALVTQLVLGRRRREQMALGTQARTGGGGLLAAFDARLPFEPTAGQREIGAVIEAELARPHPMNRLLQGEVGSGKTLVAVRAMLRVVDSGGQAALLAPTEVLAQQHHRAVTGLLGDLAGGGMLGGAAEATAVELLTGSMTKTQRRGPLSRVASGEAGIVIGTHTLLEDLVQFADLGLVVVDEQHRFGVEQRAALTDKAGSPPHVLVMTATPIPRTVAMTVFGDLELSTLSELPAGRAEISTTVVPLAEQPHWEERVWARVREEVAAGHQAYVVCPRITRDESEQGEHDQLDLDEDGALLVSRVGTAATSVTDLVADLREGALAGLRVEALHGALPAEAKDIAMRAFAAGDVDVLVATTVIEVGVDVANATVMVITDADRFGVSQLHQLRGRVGRGGLSGLCLLLTRAEAGSPGRRRLDAVAATTDGFALSEVDLEQRREGDVLGASQSGYRSSLRSLRVLRDAETIADARAAAERLLDRDFLLEGEPLLAAAVAELEDSARSDYLDKS